MRAKYIYENILIPKSKEDILDSMKYMKPDKLLVQSVHKNFIEGVKHALENGANVHIMNDENLRIATENGQTEIVKLLLYNGADVHAKNDICLQNASFHGYYDIVKLLLDNGADVHADQDYSLRSAITNNKYEIVKLLLDNGADVHVLNNRPIKLAKHYKYDNISELLTQYM